MTEIATTLKKQTKRRHPCESRDPVQKRLRKQLVIPTFLRNELFSLDPCFRRDDAGGQGIYVIYKAARVLLYLQ